MAAKTSSPSYSTKSNILVQWVRQMPYLPIGLLVATLVVGYFATNAAQQFTQNISNTKKSTAEVKLTLEKKPVAAPEYAPALAFCKQHVPDVKCELTSGKMVISISDPQFYEDWIFALNSMQAHTKDLLWETDKLCIGNCSGAAATATLLASQQNIVKK